MSQGEEDLELELEAEDEEHAPRFHVPIACQAQNYEWGKAGIMSAVARLKNRCCALTEGLVLFPSLSLSVCMHVSLHVFV